MILKRYFIATFLTAVLVAAGLQGAQAAAPSKQDVDRQYAAAQKALAQAEEQKAQAEAKKAESERRAVIARSEKPEVYVERGRIFDSRQELDNAIANYDFAIYLNPKLITAYYYRGMDLFEQRKIEAAFKDFNQVIVLNEKAKNPALRGWYMRGRCYVEMGQYDNAIKDFTIALAQTKDNKAKGQIFQHRGAAYLTLKMLPQAQTDFDALMALEPNNPNVYYYEGRVAIEKKDYPVALTNFDKAIVIDPKYTFAHFFKGRVLTFNLNRPKDGVAAFTQAANIEPGYASIYLNRAHAYVRMGEATKAKLDFAQAVKLNPNLASQVPTDAQIEAAMRPSGTNIVTGD